MLQQMIDGFPITIKKPSGRDLKYMVSLLSEEVAGFADSVGEKLKIKTTTPPFVKRLFKHFTKNVNKVTIPMHIMNKEKNQDAYGFKIFNGLFVYPDTNVFKTSLMIKLFKQIKQLAVFKRVANFNRNCWEYGASCEINDIFFHDISESICILNERGSSSFKSFMFIKPSIPSSIESFIVQNQQKFKKMNWYLSKQTYKDTYRGHCDDCLCISKSKI